MDRIAETLKSIRPLSGPATDSSPDRGLGELARTGERMALIYGDRDVGSPLRSLLFIAAADHGVSSAGSEPAPRESTADLVARLLAGQAVAAKIAAMSNLRAIVADCGVEETIEVPAASRDGGGWAEFVRARAEVEGKVLSGTADVTSAAALSRDAALAAVRAGVDAVKEACSGDGIDLLGAGAVGRGGEVAACAIAAVLTGKCVDDLVGGESRYRRALAKSVASALDRPSPDPLDAIGVLAEYGGLDIGGLVGVYLAAAARRMPIVLGGLVSTAAAAIAVDVAPAARSYFIVSDRSTVPAHGALQEYLGYPPLMSLGLDSCDGTGAALGIGLAATAFEIVRSYR